jgi:hypothetical protein
MDSKETKIVNLSEYKEQKDHKKQKTERERIISEIIEYAKKLKW